MFKLFQRKSREGATTGCLQATTNGYAFYTNMNDDYLIILKLDFVINRDAGLILKTANN